MAPDRLRNFEMGPIRPARLEVVHDVLRSLFQVLDCAALIVGDEAAFDRCEAILEELQERYEQAKTLAGDQVVG